ncbi:MAG: hypothetical protein NC400_03410 [Clostridium sp.]|nr:hypothetical protein [Clostridium sp.]
MSVKRLIEGLQNPSEEFTPIPFWFFNDSPDETRIKEQLKDYVDKGVNGLVLHPRIGIPREIPYLSEKYFKVVKFVVKTADELSMKVVLYDEGMYPSGSAHGLVVAANPEYAAKGITITKEPGADPVIAALPGERYLVRRKTGGTIRGIHFGEDDGEAGAPAAADILNPEAVKLFIHFTHDRYYEELKEYFGNTVIGFFTDEPCALGRNAESYRDWAEGMEREIVEAGGKLAELEALFTGGENPTVSVYRKLIKKHLRETFYGALRDWCESHGIWLMGHPAESDDVEEELYFYTPGQDLIMRRVAPETGGLLEFDSVQAKLAADIARHLGRRRNSNECFGVCCREEIPWYFTGKDMKWYLNWMGIRGVNLFIPHAFYYSVAGKRKEERPPDVGPNNIWWKHYKLFSDYMKRLSYLMTDSANGAKIAVLCDNNRIPYKEIAVFYENQIEFNYLPAALLADCQAEENALCIQGYRYEAVLNLLGEEYDGQIFGTEIFHSAEELLQDRFRIVLVSEQCPALRAAHLYKEETEIFLLSNEGQEHIRTRVRLHGGFGGAGFELVGYDLWKNIFYPLCCGGGNVEEGFEIEMLPCEMAAVVRVGDEQREEVLKLAEHAAGAGVSKLAEGGIRWENSEVENALGKKGRSYLAGTVRKPLENWNGRFTAERRQDNQAEYSYIFEAEDVTGAEAFEVTGEEMAECYCNGNFAGVSFYSPHRFEIGPFLQKGENEIRLVLTGNAANIYDDAGLFFGLER